MRKYLFLSPQNKALIQCPIFNATVKVASCVTLRDKVWRNEQIAVRKGCQACMRSSKCPVAEMVRRAAFNLSATNDHLGSREEKIVPIEHDLLARIRPVIVMNTHIRDLDVPAIEQQLIATANKRIDAAMQKAPQAVKQSAIIRSPRRPNKTKVTSPVPNERLKDAALTGNLAAAIG